MKTIVVTGTSSGVGLEISRLFVNKGWRVIGLARKMSSNANGTKITQR